MSVVLVYLSVPALFLLMLTAERLNERPMVRVRSWTGVLLIASAAVLITDTGMWAYYLLWSSVW